MNQSGFVFINRLGVPLSVTVEGTDLDEMKNKILDGLIKETDTNETRYKTEADRDEAISRVDKNDPKANFKILAIHSKY